MDEAESWEPSPSSFVVAADWPPDSAVDFTVEYVVDLAHGQGFVMEVE